MTRNVTIASEIIHDAITHFCQTKQWTKEKQYMTEVLMVLARY